MNEIFWKISILFRIKPNFFGDWVQLSFTSRYSIAWSAIWVRLTRREPVEMKNGKIGKDQKSLFLYHFMIFRISWITCKNTHDKICPGFWMVAGQSSRLVDTETLLFCSCLLSLLCLPKIVSQNKRTTDRFFFTLLT